MYYDSEGEYVEKKENYLRLMIGDETYYFELEDYVVETGVNKKTETLASLKFSCKTLSRKRYFVRLYRLGTRKNGFLIYIIRK